MEIIVQKLHPDHINKLCEYAYDFFEESNFKGKLTLRKEGFKQLITDYHNHPFCAALVAYVNGDMAGYSLIYAQNDYTVEMVGELFQFYVRPEYRQTLVARKLVEASKKQYNEWNCARAYCEASSGIAVPKYLKLFENLWKKHDYKVHGVTLMCELK